MRRFLRYLRIAFSATCLVACMLLIALWVRSYIRTEYVERFVNVNRLYATGIREQILNLPGNLVFVDESVTSTSINYEPPGWKYYAYEGVRSEEVEFRWRFTLPSSPQHRLVPVPHYLAVLAIGVAGVAPWMRWSKRFSIRTLLIATTLVAVVLGAIVYAAR
jgi:hypothetical protein